MLLAEPLGALWASVYTLIALLGVWIAKTWIIAPKIPKIHPQGAEGEDPPYDMTLDYHSQQDDETCWS